MVRDMTLDGLLFGRAWLISKNAMQEFLEKPGASVSMIPVVNL
jgi:hypothetical protein